MMRTKLGKNVLLLLFALLSLLIYITLRIYVDRQSSLSGGKIMFGVESCGQKLTICTWHNYYDGKEYLFLPSFCTPENTRLTVSTGFLPDLLGTNQWDGKSTGLFSGITQVDEGQHVLSTRNQIQNIEVMYSANVDSLFLTTSSGSLSYIEEEKGNGEKGTYCVYGSDGKQISVGQMSELKSRGNATFLEDKKPYQMSLVQAADLLGTGELKHYILLANRQDQSLLRDRIMYDLSGEIGLKYSPVCRPIDLYINQEYRGSYLLSEKVEVADNRLPINTDSSLAKPGFLTALEYSRRIGTEVTDPVFYTDNHQAVIVKRPQKPSDEQMAYIKSVFQRAEDAIRLGTLEDSGIDVDSFARKYLIEEMGKNLDAMYSSQYFYRDAVTMDSHDDSDSDPLLYAGPIWDYDKTLGNPLIEHTRPVDFQEPRGIYAASLQEDASWWYDLYQVPEFKEEVVQIFAEDMLPAINELIEKKLTKYRDEIWYSAKMDYYRWDTFEDFKNGEELEFDKEYRAEIDYIREFTELRAQFLKDIWVEGRKYDVLTLDPDGGYMPVSTLDAVEGRVLIDPRHPKKEGYHFAHWIRTDTGEVWDFDTLYDGEPFELKAIYEKEEE